MYRALASCQLRRHLEFIRAALGLVEIQQMGELNSEREIAKRGESQGEAFAFA